MSEPLKNPGQQPESYQPQKPEMMRVLEGAQSAAEPATGQHAFTGGAAVKPTDYDFLFSPFRDMDFTNCFTSLYAYLEDIREPDDYDCAKKRGEPCRHPDCHHACWQTMKNQVGSLFFLFDTMSGRSATVRGWGNKPTAIYSEIYDTDDMIDFLMGFVGYGYVKHTDNLMEHVRASLNEGIPVIARLKKGGAAYLDGEGDSFRLITGCDGGKLLMPKPQGSQKAPKKAPKLNEIDSVYVLTGRAQRKHTQLDGLRRIKRVMDADREAGAWDQYIHAFEGYHERLQGLSSDAFKQLFEFACKAAVWNCHNFAEVFRWHKGEGVFDGANWIWADIRRPELKEPCCRIDWACDRSHTLQWQLHHIYDGHEWSEKNVRRLGWGMCETFAMILREIKAEDEIVYGAVCEMIGILEEASS
jgi:hypothetical protein